jgi:hypothetical protein
MEKSKVQWWGIPFVGAIAVALSTSGDPPWWWCKFASCGENICDLAATANSWHKYQQNKNTEAMNEAMRHVGSLAGSLEVHESNEQLREMIRNLQPCMRSYDYGKKCDIKAAVYDLAENGQCFK